MVLEKEIGFREKDSIINNGEKVNRVGELVRSELQRFVTPTQCSTSMLRTQPWRTEKLYDMNCTGTKLKA